MTLAPLIQRAQKWLMDDDTSYLYTASLSGMLTSAPPPYPGLRIVVCDNENLAQVQAMAPNFPTLIARYVQDGNMAFLAATEDTWIFRSVAILGARTYHVHGYPLVLTRQDVYLEAAETHPDWRGKGVAPGMLAATAQALIARGYQTAYITISTSNTASCRAIEKGGAQRQGLLTTRRRCGRWTAHYTQEHIAVLPGSDV